MLERVKNFTTLVGLSALLVAGSAAFFSVFGLSKLFSGAQLSVIIMAGSLEFTKLVAASFLYQYWYTASKILKTYLGIGVVVLVLITSAGIFGYLSNAYQGATINFEKQSTTLLYKEDRLEQLEDDKTYLKEEGKSKKPIAPGPFNGFLKKLNIIQSKYPANKCPIRIALVTARAAPAHKRVINTLRKENIRIDETFFLGGLSKGKFLKGFSADIFFDDLTENCIEATSHVSTGHVPYGINNPK